MTIWVTSDTHFGHKALAYRGFGSGDDWKPSPHHRLFEDEHQYDRAIIASWNNTVDKNDVVYHLGDFSFSGKTRQFEILSQLKGNIIFARGNHDKEDVVGNDWLLRVKLPNLEYPIIMSHCPYAIWENKERGSIHLHGHLHGEGVGTFSQGLRRFDVGMCAEYHRTGRRFRLHNLEELAAQLLQINYKKGRL